jgi:hypothetical protein
VLVLELVSRGDLLKWMNKMASSKKKFSNKVLWRFFECRKFRWRDSLRAAETCDGP